MIAKAETLVGRIQVAQVDLEQVINRLKRALSKVRCLWLLILLYLFNNLKIMRVVLQRRFFSWATIALQ